MSDVVIRARALSKRYRIGQRQPYDALREVLVDAAGKAWQLLSGRRQQPASNPEYIWAVDNLSLDVKRGEVVGLIGHNGAGKSTLLKILSRVTWPTRGEVRLRGRVGSLLEVGTGFHPELTGRENVFLNGAVLGMRRSEIERKFDEIVAFSGVEQFLDTPIKRYSSGMYLRLAFAVAAHLEPEILLVDEVLAVGDAEFQRKCLGKMEDVAQEGRTVLVVSHNMTTVQRLCSRVLLFDSGRIVASGRAADVVESYLAAGFAEGEAGRWLDLAHVKGKGGRQARVISLRYQSDQEKLGGRPYPGGPLEIGFMVEAANAGAVGSFAATIYDHNGIKLVNADTVVLGQKIRLQQGVNTVRLRIDNLHLNPGVYTLGWWIADPVGRVLDYVVAGIDFEVTPMEAEEGGIPPENNGLVPCTFHLLEVTHSATPVYASER